ncbi:MAG: LacI family DNA-binding transcriptional regulator, partial [Clostridia bacterium]|nr:LacI family DNA-binding transcriptional regulator [Clostridia bacterium]
IQIAIEETGFTPNYFGRSLKAKETKTIGVITYNISSRFVSAVHNVLEKRLAKDGYDVYFCNTHGDLDLEKEKLQFLLRHGADAIVLFPKSYEHSSIELPKTAGIPTVLVDNTIKNESCSSVVFDDKNSAYTATQHLIRNGHKKIACLAGYDDYCTTISRIKGYKKALADNGITESIVCSNLVTTAEHTEATLKILQEHPDVTAFIITSSALLVGFLSGLKTMQLSVPDDISYITFGEEEYYELLTVTPTYVYQDKEQLGNNIFDVISELLTNKEAIVNKTVPTRLILGGTVKNLSAEKKDLISF